MKTEQEIRKARIKYLQQAVESKDMYERAGARIWAEVLAWVLTESDVTKNGPTEN